MFRFPIFLCLVPYADYLATTAANNGGLLYPISGATRDMRSLDGSWKLRFGKEFDPEEGFRESWYSRPLQQVIQGVPELGLHFSSCISFAYVDLSLEWIYSKYFLFYRMHQFLQFECQKTFPKRFSTSVGIIQQMVRRQLQTFTLVGSGTRQNSLFPLCGSGREYSYESALHIITPLL